MLTLAGIVTSILGAPFRLAAHVGLTAVSAFVVAGAAAILHEVVAVISTVTTPSLTASWFSPVYWRVAGLAALLTVPFLFAAAVQAIVRGDPGILLRAGFIDLPIAMVAVSLAAPLVELALAATDEMCQFVTGPGADTGELLARTAALLPITSGSFIWLAVAGVIVCAGLVLTVELVLRSAAIYIVVLFLPLGFAGMVWPARRIWIKRMTELLVSLILAKFAMVAILSLSLTGLSSLAAGAGSLTTALSAMALMLLAAGSPWALLKLLPFTEMAAEVGGMLHGSALAGAGDLLPAPAWAAAHAIDGVGGAAALFGRHLFSASDEPPPRTDAGADDTGEAAPSDVPEISMGETPAPVMASGAPPSPGGPGEGPPAGAPDAGSPPVVPVVAAAPGTPDPADLVPVLRSEDAGMHFRLGAGPTLVPDPDGDGDSEAERP